MVRLKNGVSGFIYDSEYGEVVKIYKQPLSEEKIETINEVLSEDDILFTDNEDLNDMFEFDCKEDLEKDVENLNEVLEWVE